MLPDLLGTFLFALLPKPYFCLKKQMPQAELDEDV
jgi:hypothetical protein